jgi:hypothetical protein
LYAPFIHLQNNIINSFSISPSGEQGALSSFPLFMIDQKVTSADIGFWVGIIGQMTSIFGSALGGFLLSKCQ